MHEWISFNPERREVWRGHETKEGVRRSIAHAKRWNEALRIFVRDGGYMELVPAEWETAFAKD